MDGLELLRAQIALQIEWGADEYLLDAPQNHKIVRSLIDLAHNLELKVVAEGVETQEILGELTSLGCDHAQGWDVGKPTTAADLMTRMRDIKG